jgi:hypothetical protein
MPKPTGSIPESAVARSPQGRSRRGSPGGMPVGLLIAAGVLVLLIPPVDGQSVRGLVGLTIGLYVANVSVYSAWMKHWVIADVMGFRWVSFCE